MIRIIFLLFFLSSCGNLPIAYIQNFSSVNNVIFGFEDYQITKEIFDDYEYSFMKVRFGRGPHSILILAFVEEDIYEWAGQDEVKIFTKDGRVIKTLGLDHNFEILGSRDDIYPKDTSSYELLNLYNPDLYSTTLSSNIYSSTRSIKRFDQRTEVLEIREKINVEAIGWKDTNYYYRNPSNNLIEKSLQNIHPRLPTMKIEYYYKF